MVHLLQPVAHLALLGLCGPASWRPLLASLGLDLASLALHRAEEAATLEAEAEMQLRYDAFCAETGAEYWPCVPLNMKFDFD